MVSLQDVDAEKKDDAVTLPAVDTASEQEEDGAARGSLLDYCRIFRYTDSTGWMLNLLALITAVAGGATMPLMTVVFGQSTDSYNKFAAGTISGDQFKAEVTTLVYYYLYLFAGRFVVSYAATLAVSIAGIRTTRALRQAFLNHILRMHIWHFDLPSAGSPAAQVTSNGTRINQGIADRLVTITQAMATLVSAFIIAVVVQWKLALITMVALPVIFIVTGICMSIEIGHESKVTAACSQAAVIASEALSSIRTVHAFWAQEKLLKRYDEYLIKAHKHGNKKSLNYGVLFSVEYFCVYSTVALSFWQGYRMYASGEIEGVGKVMTVVLSTLIAATSISSLAPHLSSISNAAAAAGELFAIMDKKTELDPFDDSGVKPDKCEGDIRIHNLNFCYPSRPGVRVLNNMTLSIPAGKNTALVGASGCGKSTIIGLLERWYQAESGSITLDSIELSDYNTKWLRTHIRLVQQEPVLFNGTVYENVCHGLVDEQRKLPETEKRRLVEEACKSSNAHDFIKLLPEGYDTQIGERAGTISGGQKQRIAIARSIISNPSILLLDEATSALDPQAEMAVQDALNRVSKNRTTVTIAHRLSTIKDADNIVVLSSGEVMEQGTHDELIARDGHYAKLVLAQGLGVKNRDTASTISEGDSDMLESKENTLALKKTKTQPSDDKSIPDKDVAETMPEYSVFRLAAMFIAEQKNLYGIVAIATTVSVLAAATFPGQALVFSGLINVFISKDNGGEANFWSLMFFVIALGNLFCLFLMGFTANQISQTSTHKYRKEMFDRIIKMDIAFYDRPENTSGAVASRLSTVPNALQELLSFNMFTILSIIANILASSALAIGLGWRLGLVVTLGGMPPLIGAGYLRIHIETQLDKSNGVRFGESAGLASEAVASIRTVASLTLEQDFLDRYSHAIESIIARSIKTLVIVMIPYAFSQSVDYLVIALGFWYGTQLIVSGEYTTTQFFKIVLAALFAGQAAGQFFTFTTSLTNGQSAGNYILWLRAQRPVVRVTDENKDNKPDPDAGMTLEKVEFRYPQRPDIRVLKRLDMDIHQGQFVALVGASGCGKSTLVALLERYYDPNNGRIAMGGTDIRTLSPMLYRQQISLVQQEPVLYQGTVADNISLGLAHDPTDAELEDACRQANAWEFIASLPEGLATPCGSRGMSFSGGQRQRIAIARALVRNPRILLLDEATSALDTHSERVVQAALNQAARNSSRIMIAVAHRLSTIRDADVIYVFAEGGIAESGTHEELQAKRGLYYQMCLAQSLNRTV
ncbi:P-loop containing nucleoside triphosphate hydrolase protein [Hypomontagnella monticulosa]|nr:P-loop containing nucleoside triphosphate hydrolase protein [Hypomontagnella monticulosa]